jgi:hypothetical protein
VSTMPSFVRVDPEKVAAQLVNGEAIIINFGTGVYYSMDGVGAEVWSLLEATGDVDRTVTVIRSRYDVDPARARSDVERLTGELLVEQVLLAAASPADKDEDPLAAEAGRVYAAPVLHIYRDMNELMALDPPVPGLTPIPWDDPTAPRPQA